MRHLISHHLHSQTFVESFPTREAACNKHQSTYSIWKASDICLIINRVRITTHTAQAQRGPLSPRVSDTSGPALTLSSPAHDSWSSWSLLLCWSLSTVSIVRFSAPLMPLTGKADHVRLLLYLQSRNQTILSEQIVRARISKNIVTVREK